MRKGLRYGIALAACGGWFGSSDAAYVIRLKNGNEYITTRYWQEGGQVLFDTYGGVFGIERAFVAKIERTERNVKLPVALDHVPSLQTQPGSKNEADEEDKMKVKADVPVKKERASDDPIVGEFNRLKELSAQVDGMLTSEIRALLNQITEYKNKLSKDSKLFIEYGREFNDAHEIGAVVETALRTRTQ